MWLVYSLKGAFLIGHYSTKHLRQQFWMEWNDRKDELFIFRKLQLQPPVAANIQAELWSFWSETYHLHLQWFSHGRSHLKRPKHWSLKKMALHDTLMQVALWALLSTTTSYTIRGWLLEAWLALTIGLEV